MSENHITPEHILMDLRQRSGLEADDKSIDEKLIALSPEEKLRMVVGWHLGDESWAGSFLDWAKACGMKIDET